MRLLGIRLRPRILQTIIPRCPKTYSYDPFYISRKPSIPLYPKLQFCLTGFPLPPKKTSYSVFHPNSTKVKTEFELNHYCRVVTADNIKTVDLPVIFDLIQQNLPEGIELTIEEFNPDLEEERYVANLEIETLQDELTKLTTK
ncbi:hypothetical protein ACTXT7_008101 [Hymenolepis weldensis]